jgi:membrane protein
MAAVGVPAQLISWARGVAEPLLRFNVIDRSLVLGAQAFGALIPLMIVLEGAQPGDHTLEDDLVNRFGLHGEAAESVHAAFAITTTEPTGTTALGVVVLTLSALSFTRRLQRVYEETWELPSRRFRGIGAGLSWLAFLVGWSLLQGFLGDDLGVVASLASVFLVGVITPYLLLGRRVGWRELVPQGALAAVGMTALGVWTVIYMPRTLSSTAGEYGAIGVAFALLTWLWGVGIVMVCSAVYGASPTTRSAAPLGRG